MKLCVLFFGAFVVSVATGAKVQYLSAVLDIQQEKLTLLPGKQQGAVAWASFDDALFEEGWSYLEIRTNPGFDDDIAAYAAGALEGNLTQHMMKSHYLNLYEKYCDGNAEYCAKLKDYFNVQLNWMIERSKEERSRSPFWNQVFLLLKQLSGLEDAYNNKTLIPANFHEDVTWLYFTNNEGAIFDLEKVFNRTQDSNSLFSVSPCSMLVKPTSNNFLLGHTSWTSYRFMLRLQKKYMFPFKVTSKSSTRIPGNTISMSSYPGKLSSFDDFYSVSTGLVVSETTNDIYNETLYKHILPTSVPAEFRAMVANRIATNGRHWTRQFEKHNSGTYNNQWVVIDYNKINITENGVAIGNETFWMLEQLPTLVVMKDMTDILRTQGYWSSYNVPYFPDIYEESGYAERFKEHGDRYSHDNCPRGKIFRRDQIKVTDNTSMMKMLRYNDFKNDPLSRCNCTPPYSPVSAIASRYDLLDPKGVYDDPDLKMKADGAIDAKIADFDSVRDFSFNSISGPTYDQQPVFSWSKSPFNSNTPLGHPDTFAFKPIRHKWSL